MTTLGEALRDATSDFAAAGIDTARLDAELLLCEASGLDRPALAGSPDRDLGAEAAVRWGELVGRRLAREPVAYILGRKGFRHLDIEVDHRVLIPRPESELLVEIALELGPASVLDVGTGSGAVALAIADELPDCAVTASDSSAAALEVAHANIERLGLADRVELLIGTIPPGRRFDLIVANLPYVAEGERGSLQPELGHEPEAALFAGPDGLEAIRALLAGEPDCDAIALEIGAGQAPEVVGLVAAAGFGEVTARPDLAGIDRVVVGDRSD